MRSLGPSYFFPKCFDIHVIPMLTTQVSHKIMLWVAKMKKDIYFAPPDSLAWCSSPFLPVCQKNKPDQQFQVFFFFFFF